MPSALEEPAVTSRKELVGWFLIAQLPFRWIWRAVEEFGNVDFIITRANDPGWMGAPFRMLAEIFRWPEVVIFVIGVGWLGYLYRSPQSRQELVSEQRVVSLPPPSSPRDEMNREKIVILSCRYAEPAYGVALQVARRLWDQVRSGEDPKDWTIALFFYNYPLALCGHASSVLSHALDDPDNNNIEVLQQRLKEFFDAYQGLVKWTNCVVRTFSYPLNGDPEYDKWQEKHKKFYQMLGDLMETKDFAQLRRSLRGEWEEIIG